MPEFIDLTTLLLGSALLFIGSMILQPQNSKDVDTFVYLRFGWVTGLIAAAVIYAALYAALAIVG